ncbi:MAG TPA: alpha/beta hydrolase [Acidimicrobiales bacterium]|nr:alpha/beta hydrolase [Acidimicrobiales bacterium]
MRTVAVNDVELAYVEQGEGDPILFVHGWCCDHTYFAPQADHLATSRRVVSVDLRGHGASDKPEGDYSIATFAADIAAFGDALGLDRPVIVGHSMGGAIAFHVARDHPGATRGVVGVDPALFFDEGLREIVRVGGTMIAGDESGEIHRGLVEGSLFLETDDPELKDRVVREMTAVPRHVLVPAFQDLGEIDASALVEACMVPAMVVWADRDDMDLGAIAETHGHVDFRQTLGVGHFNQLLAPGEVNAHLDDFLEQFV